jgi:hypothetical protein
MNNHRYSKRLISSDYLDIVTLKESVFIVVFCNSARFVWLILAIAKVCNFNFWSATLYKIIQFLKSFRVCSKSARSKICFDSICHNVVSHKSINLFCLAERHSQLKAKIYDYIEIYRLCPCYDSFKKICINVDSIHQLPR